jgi:hypothetical protein
VETLGARFEVDVTTLRIDVLGEFASGNSVQSEGANELVLKYALALVSQALREDNFASAVKMYDIAITAARRAKDLALIRNLQQKRQEIDVARAAYRDVEEVLSALDENPYDPDANLVVGRYYCFVKGDWEQGLPLLARCGDNRLRGLADAELELPELSLAQLELGDGWWGLGADHELPQRRHMQLRGVSWYLKALAQLPAGLHKIKIENRLKEAQQKYGKLAAAPPAAASAAGRAALNGSARTRAP